MATKNTTTETIYACQLTKDKMIQVTRPDGPPIRGKIAALALSKGRRGSWGMAVVTLKNGRRLILSGSAKVKVSA